MWCSRCAYYDDPPDGVICQPCGRYLRNKIPEIIIVLVLSTVLGLFSHYLLIGEYFGARPLVWLQTALTAPYSIYDSPAYYTSVALTLAGLVAISTLAGFHYGVPIGIFAGLLAGALSGVEAGLFAFPVIAALAGAPRVRRMPGPAWPLVAAAAAVLYYLHLAKSFGPGEAIYHSALYRFLFEVGAVALLLVVTDAVFTHFIRYRSEHFVIVALILAATPMALFYQQIGPADFQARRLTTLYDPAKMLNIDLPKGYVTGLSDSTKSDLRPGRQLGHVFDVAGHVNRFRQNAVGACDAYLKRYGSSAHAAGVMLMKAALVNTRVDFHLLTQSGRLEVYFDRVDPESLPLYDEIIARFGGTPRSALAMYYKAEGAFQAGKIPDAQKIYAQALKDLAPYVPEDFRPMDPPAPASVRDLYRAGDAQARQLNRSLYDALLAVRRRLATIAANSDFAAQPLQRLAVLDPKSEGFQAAIRNLIESYPGSQLVDNARLLVIEQVPDPAARAAELESLLELHADSDVKDAALLAYARALYQTNAGGQGAARARDVLRGLIAGYPSSTYAAEAARLLVEVSTASGPRPAASAVPQTR